MAYDELGRGAIREMDLRTSRLRTGEAMGNILSFTITDRGRGILIS